MPAKPTEVLVYMEDVSRADAASLVVGEQIRRDLTLCANQALPFEIEVFTAKIDARNFYSVRAHIDVSQTGDATIGDFVST